MEPGSYNKEYINSKATSKGKRNRFEKKTTNFLAGMPASNSKLSENLERASTMSQSPLKVSPTKLGVVSKDSLSPILALNGGSSFKFKSARLALDKTDSLRPT